MSFRTKWGSRAAQDSRMAAAGAKRNRRALRLRYAVLRGGFGTRAQLDEAARYPALGQTRDALAFYLMSRREKRRWFARQGASR